MKTNIELMGKDIQQYVHKRAEEKFEKEMELEMLYCQECGTKLDLLDEYQKRWRTCDVKCYTNLVC